jgi:hypothetical protein
MGMQGCQSEGTAKATEPKTDMVQPLFEVLSSTVRLIHALPFQYWTMSEAALLF